MQWVWFALGLTVLASLWWPAKELDRRIRRQEEFWEEFARRYHLDDQL